ncbi:MAG: immunity 42 family protein [Planctomycetaceae bacterium]|jgi:hypothetical protein|nr:immunity 42 family protein [Planctomycetaceae bacterium]
MIIGDPNIFAIDYIIKDVSINYDDKSEWTHGSLLFYFNNYIVGDVTRWVNFKDCVYWMEDMIKRKIHIPTKQYSNLSAEKLMTIFKTKSVVDLGDYNYKVDDAINAVKSMSHDDLCEGLELYQLASIEYIGERSLDQVLTLMIDDETGFKRFIIQQRKENVCEFVVKTEFIIKTVQEFIDSYKKEVKKNPVHYFVIRDNTTVQLQPEIL